MSKSQERITQLTNHISNHASEKSQPRLCSKVCIITGAGSELGIGRASAWEFAKNGAKAVYVTDSRSDPLPQLAREIQAKYPNTTVIPRQVDAASEEAVKSVIQDALDRFGRLDVFFANAAVASETAFMNTDASRFMEIMRINTLSVFLAIKHASAAMKVCRDKDGKKEVGGSIIATASVAGMRFGAGGTDYSASKAAVINLVKTGACNLAGTNIRVNAICPGLIETNMTKHIFDKVRSRGRLHYIGQLNPTLRYGQSFEIAAAAVFLASNESSYVNGQALCVDGGLTATLPIVPGQWSK